MEITQEMLDDARDDLYKAVWALVKAEQERPTDTGAEQEVLSWAIIEHGNMSFLYGKQVVRAEKPEVPKCDFCLEVDIFQPMVQRANHVICQTCADNAQAEVDAENRAHDQL
jgi:formylmethanofuran dehydrogenase subunit E